MNFNSYIVQLKHKENALTGILRVCDKNISANFKKIGTDLYIVNFKIQVEFQFLQKLELKNRDKEAIVLLPVLSKYNKRKITKIAKFLSPQSESLNHLLFIFQ